MPFQFKLNLDSELIRLFGDYQLIVPSCVLSEVRKLQSSEKFGASALKLALKKPAPAWYKTFETQLLHARNKPKEIKDEKNGRIKESEVDDEILQIAKALNGIVVTNDKTLMRKLQAHGVSTISLRGGKYLKLNSYK